MIKIIEIDNLKYQKKDISREELKKRLKKIKIFSE